MIDPRAQKQWEKARLAYDYYADFIRSKLSRHDLSISDLLFVTNFKGGNATVNEPPSALREKLKAYTVGLESICREFKNRSLASLDESELNLFCDLADAFVGLASKLNTHIDGFGESFTSTLLHFHFPELAPILDKRALNGAGVEGLDVDSNNNVRNLGKLYAPLIRKCHTMLKEHLAREKECTLVELDQKLYCQILKMPPFKKKRKGKYD